MSWLARSLATSLNIPEDDPGADDDPDSYAAAAAPSPSARNPHPPQSVHPHPPHSAAAEGVKEDLTELSKTLTRQFWGVANFLAPPPGETSPSPSPPSAEARYGGGTAQTPPEISGIRSDFAEIGGRFKSGISRISNHKAMSGFSRIASNFFADEDEEEEELVDAVRGYGVEEQREELRFRAEEVATDRVRHEADDYEVRHGWEESVRHRVDDDEARHEVDDDEGRHDEWEERLKHEADGGEVMHKELDDHELELETVRHEEEEEEVEEEWDVIGITEEVLAFATNIARHPETWLDFPLLPDDDDSDGPFSYFDMSNAQQEHALAIEQLAPRLAALRIELCPIHMSEECFWKIYFVLLHPRLNKHDAELLSTPQIVEARAMLMQCLQHQSKFETEQLFHRKDDFGMHSEEDTSKDIPEVFPSMLQQTASVIPITDFETEKHPIQVTEVAVVDKSVIKEQLTKDGSKTPNVLQESFDDDIDDWFDEEAELSGHTTIPIGDEEDVSFSDLEDDDGK
ncbi:uncharacterized protein [Oryza sativa Japonica Group]|uniref:BSD domain containing protein n=3 Tax=Oryza TaxID=4527 RepID=A0A8J8YK61_ORYSJ|nr:uncharacterized protein LOC4333994 [Oryza sativa Japonica Group]KAB8093412.1 hypothetical protein EE612_020221 [Oryza sativa]AAO38477.1 putative BSD domain containing protein [Oryza sativa Japonica Group]ABF98685.1 BSD domain containing protein, expressed [Oryza sativa Japonica Group]EEE59862.1 hypothetical protein OsJ_12445 [Oryza sativa Japonica Group]KAF2941125.1 hypothetical protein DAI22_03g325100 [Oryza sativa Japonica Group]